MALRSVLRKMPALGLRSSPLGPLMGPVRALSPAAASRLTSSHGAPIDKLESAIEEYRLALALSNASIAETMRLYEQDHQSLMKKFDIIDKACTGVLIACQLSVALMMMYHAM